MEEEEEEEKKEEEEVEEEEEPQQPVTCPLVRSVQWESEESLPSSVWCNCQVEQNSAI